MRKKILFSLSLFLIFFALGTVVKVKADNNETGRGWIWGGSESSQDSVIPPEINGNETGLGLIYMNNVDENGNIVSGSFDFGVNIPNGDGNLDGYGWSENVGWIDFNPQGHCVTASPGAGQYQAASCSPPVAGYSAVVSRSGDALNGWARIISIAQATVSGNSGGYDGWISMSQATDGSGFAYGVDVNNMDGTGNNPTYAWSGDLGWIDFSKAEAVFSVTYSLEICVDSCNSGKARTGTASMIKGQSENIIACYNSVSGCNDPAGTNVTDSSTCTWAESEGNPDDGVLEMSYGNPMEVSAKKEGSEKISATYTFNSVNYSAEYTADVVCIPDCSCANNLCSGQTCVEQICETTCSGTKDCGWKEVAP